MSQENITQAAQTQDNTDTSGQNFGNVSSPKMFTEEEVQKIVDEKLRNKEIEHNDRLKNKDMEHKRKTEATMKRLSELENKEKAGTATTEESIESSAGKDAQAKAKNEGIHPDAIPYIVQEEMDKKKYAQSIVDAAEKDPQFKTALQDPKSRMLINQDQEYFLKDLPNAPDVLKTLLTNRKENNLMQAKFQEMIHEGKPSVFVQYMNDLSEKLEKSSTGPRAPSYTADANLSDFGDSAQGFDLKNHIKNHR